MFGTVIEVCRIDAEEAQRGLPVTDAGIQNYNGIAHLAVEFVLDGVDPHEGMNPLDIRQ